MDARYTLIMSWIWKEAGNFNLMAFDNTILTTSKGPSCRSISLREGWSTLRFFELNQTVLPTLYSGAIPQLKSA